MASAVAANELPAVMTSSPGPISRRAQGHVQGVGPIGHSHTMFGAAIVGKFRFKLGDFLSQNVIGFVNHTPDACQDFVFDTCRLGGQVDQWNGLCLTCTLIMDL